MRRLLAIAAGVCLLVLGLQVPAADAAVTSGDLVFSDITHGGDLYLVHQDGTGLRRLTWTGDANNPAWSPDGRTVAYDHAGDLWLLTLGVGKRRLTFNGQSSDPTWSPDGTRIAYSRVVRGYLRDVFVMPAAGGSSTRITYAARSGCSDVSPAWRPVGGQIAFVREHAVGVTCTEGIVLRRPGGPGLLVVPEAAADQPDFTADGQHLIFQAPCDPERCANTGGWETTAFGADRHMVVDQYLCAEGDLCLHGLVAAPTGGWVSAATYADPDTGFVETCYQGAVESASGEVTLRAPSFCVRVLGYTFDVRP